MTAHLDAAAPADAELAPARRDLHALGHGSRAALRRDDDALGAHVAFALLPPDRAQLHATIAERFDAMLAAGLVAELAALVADETFRRTGVRLEREVVFWRRGEA